jgi:hypothetical protein
VPPVSSLMESLSLEAIRPHGQRSHPRPTLLGYAKAGAVGGDPNIRRIEKGLCGGPKAAAVAFRGIVPDATIDNSSAINVPTNTSWKDVLSLPYPSTERFLSCIKLTVCSISLARAL